MAQSRRSHRSNAPFTDAHLKRLVSLARSDETSFFKRNPHLGVYRDRLLLIALCQGGALHYLDSHKQAEKTNGVKDLDVYSFYADHPEVPWPYRRHGVADFGESRFGYHPNKRPDFVGRHVDLMGRTLPVEPNADPVLAVRDWLATSTNKTPRLLRMKAVVGLYPAKYRGKIIWDPYAESCR
jgi:nitroreductase